MTDLLVRIFVKDHENIKNIRVRRSYGTLSSIVGIVCNIFLFIVKYIIGTLANSISIVSDAFNNLSDSASCIIALIGYKMAAKPADKDHPFGHGRVEYLVTLVIAALIFLVGTELMKDSFYKTIYPEKITFSVYTFVVLILSVAVKLWMAFFNTRLGKRIDSSVMLAAAKDSRSDVIATSAALTALICSVFTDFPVDGFTGMLVSLFIIKSGMDIVRDMINELIGKPADPQLIDDIKQIVLSSEKVIGLHDLMIHNYGPGNLIGSCHAEVDYKEELVVIHDVIDTIERRIAKELGVNMTIHIDPVETDSRLRKSSARLLKRIIADLSPSLEIHDLRTVKGDDAINLIFDIAVPYEFKYSNDEIKIYIDSELEKETENYFTVIVFDRENI